MTDLLTRPVLLDQPWELSPSVAIRPEPFGALAYHFGTRRLTFLKRPALAAVVRDLGVSEDVRSALAEAGVPPNEWNAYCAALQALAAMGMIRLRDTEDGPDDRG
jgi:mycofactocin biosynthesis protein MftB